MVTTGAIGRAKLQSYHHHQQTKSHHLQIGLLKHSLVSSTIVIFVVLTFNIALVFFLLFFFW